MNKWIAEFELEDGDTMPEHMDLEYKGAKIDFHCRPMWIPCSERLPAVRKWVLCYCRAGIMDVLRLTNDGSWNKNYPHVDYMSGFVLAWMPLPELFMEDEK